MGSNGVKRYQEVVLFAVIGAVIGGCVASALVIVVMLTESSFWLDTFIALGIGGLIGGAIGGAFIAAIRRRWLVVIGGSIGGVGGCILLAVGALWYSGFSWPSPHPYPDSFVSTSEGAIGSWGLVRSHRYTADLSLDDLQRYYELEMQRYCVDNWQFERLADPEGFSETNLWKSRGLPSHIENSNCRESQCQVRRWGLAQDFSVLLCEVSNNQTIVIQVETWED